MKEVIAGKAKQVENTVDIPARFTGENKVH